MAHPPWNPRALPPQADRVFVVTGATAGIGYFVAEQLASTGATVVLAGRSESRLETAARSIWENVPGARLELLPLDLARLSSVREAGHALGARERLDGLVENAGVVPDQVRTPTTEDGFETMFGTNHLGHFALTALAYPALKRTPGSRVVTTGSAVTRAFKVGWEEPPQKALWRGYARSKHATQIFARELDRRLSAAGLDVHALIADPGDGFDGIAPRRPGIVEATPGARLAQQLLAWLGAAQGKDRAAWVAVRAALDPRAAGGARFAPRFGGRGKPWPASTVKDTPELGRALWEKSEAMTGVPFPIA